MKVRIHRLENDGLSRILKRLDRFFKSEVRAFPAIGINIVVGIRREYLKVLADRASQGRDERDRRVLQVETRIAAVEIQQLIALKVIESFLLRHAVAAPI